MNLKMLAVFFAVTCGAFVTGCSDPCGDLDCEADACAGDIHVLDQAVCKGLVEADDSDACDAYTGCGAP